LEWPTGGRATLRGADGGVLANVDPQSVAIKESGTEALGLDVEETDLGGAAGNAKKYLGGKKTPRGRALDAQALAGKSSEPGKSETATVQGIPITTISYPNGAFLMKWEWPELREELYFDRRRSLIYNEQSRKAGPWQVTLKQFGDGSFSRNYQDERGGLTYTYDANDQSYRFSFYNAKGETTQEVVCQETCH
jgi:hypothetical protein